MTEKKPTLDYAIPEPRKRPRFLERLNPKATWRSMVRRAAIACVLAAALWGALLWLRMNPRWHPTWWLFVWWEVIAAGAGAVTEWQPLGD